jgi:hypothetical protein
MIRGYISEDDIRQHPPENSYEWENAFACVWNAREGCEGHHPANVIKWTVEIVGNGLTVRQIQECAIGAIQFSWVPIISVAINKSYLADMAEVEPCN